MSHTRERNVAVSDNVYVKNYSNYGDPWVPGIVTSKKGPVSFEVQTQDQGIVRRHANQLHPRTPSVPQIPTTPEIPSVSVPNQQPVEGEGEVNVYSPSAQSPRSPKIYVRRSERIRTTPDKLNL